MNLGTLITEARYLIDELTEDHYEDERLTAWLNEGQADVAWRLPAPLLPDLGTSWTCHLSNGVDSYTFTPEFIHIATIGLAYASPSGPLGEYRQAKIIPITDWNKLDDDPFWQGTTNWPYASVHGRTVYIDPIPTGGSSNGMKVWYTRPPTDMAADVDTPEIPSFAHRWLVQFAAYKALVEDSDERAQAQLAKYLENFTRFQPQGGR